MSGRPIIITMTQLHAEQAAALMGEHPVADRLRDAIQRRRGGKPATSPLPLIDIIERSIAIEQLKTGAFDERIKQLLAEGATGPQIAGALGIPLFRVKEAKKRLRLTKRDESYEVEIKSSLPLREYRCPVCRKKHLSEPNVWTCDSCKKKQQENGDIDVIECRIVR